MKGAESALREAVEFLEERGIPYMVIGGLANLVWGVPRATLDADVAVWVEEDRVDAVVGDLCRTFTPFPKDPRAFAAELRVLPMKSGSGRVDFVFGALPYEREAIRRAVVVKLAGRRVRVCTPEDLVIMKVLADRPRDIEDMRGVAKRQGRVLDRAYLDPIVRGLAGELSRPDLWERFVAVFGPARRRRKNI